MNITLYGAASDRIDRAYVEGVEALGRAIAKRGHTMVFGAGSTGLMGAAARGMAAEHGHIIGVTPHFMHTLEPVSDLCTELIATEDCCSIIIEAQIFDTGKLQIGYNDATDRHS